MRTSHRGGLDCQLPEILLKAPMSALVDEDEQVLYTAYLSWWGFLPHLSASLVLIAIGAAASYYGRETIFSHVAWLGFLGSLLAMGTTMVKQSVTAEVTAYHVLVKKELISLHTTTLNLHRIESVDIAQSFLQRLTGYGDVIIRGVGNEDVELPGVTRPHQLKQAVLAIRSQSDL
jgi:hypothetical protein